MRISKSALYLLRGAAVFALFFFVRFFIYFMTVGMAVQDNAQLYVDFPLWAIGLIIVIGTLFLYNSLVRLFSLYDAAGVEAFLENPVVKRRFAEYRDAFTDRYMILATLPPLLLLSIFLPLGLFSEAELLFESLGSARYAAMYALYVSAFVFSAVNSRYETRRHWRQLLESHALGELKSRVKFFIKGAAIVFIYPFAIPMSPILVFLAINAFTVMQALMGLFSTVGLGIATTLVIILLIMMPKLRALSVRRKFARRLSTVAERAGYELSGVVKEKSLAQGYAGVLRFTLKHGGREYSCRLIPIERKRRPIYFTGESSAHFLIKLGFKKHFISLTRHFEYGTEGGDRSIIILSPEPKYVFVSSDGGERRLYTGDKIWKHAVFETDSFFGAMDRHCLEKSNGMFE